MCAALCEWQRGALVSDAGCASHSVDFKISSFKERRERAFLLMSIYSQMYHDGVFCGFYICFVLKVNTASFAGPQI